jgi:hypothetical protein
VTEFTTKSTDKMAEFETGMVRGDSSGKPRFELIIPKGMPYEKLFLTRWAKLLARGAAIYEERNWEKASTEKELERYKESAFRHFMQWISGETDEDHAAAVAFNIAGAEFIKWKIENK